MKIVNLTLAVMFLLFAFVQINDPDPVLWILIYGSMAVLCVLAAFHRYYKVVMMVMLLGFIAYAIILLPGVNEWMRQEDKTQLFDDVAKMQYPYIEEAREFLGLMICVVVLMLQLVKGWKPQTG